MIPIKRLIEIVLKYGVANLFINWSLIDILRIVRNSFLILINGYSLLTALIIIVFIVYWVMNKKWSLLILFSSFLIPFLLTSKFWYGGLYGRYGSFIAYGLALMIALIPNKFFYWLTVASIIITLIPTSIAYQQKPIPLVQAQLINKKKLSQTDLLILSDYQRPQLSYKNGVYINGNENQTKTIKDKISVVLKNNRKVFITEQAINFPYWQYDGQQIHIISKGDINKAVMKQFLQNKKLIKIIEDKNYPLLSIYQIK